MKSAHYILLFLVLVCLCHAAKKDPYEVLNIQIGASYKVVRKARRDMSKLYHPDKNKSPEAVKKLLEITEAFEVKRLKL